MKNFIHLSYDEGVGIDFFEGEFCNGSLEFDTVEEYIEFIKNFLSFNENKKGVEIFEGISDDYFITLNEVTEFKYWLIHLDESVLNTYRKLLLDQSLKLKLDKKYRIQIINIYKSYIKTEVIKSLK